MQLVLALLAIMLYAAVFAAGIIITGIVEIVKHIKRQNRNPRKVKETKNHIPKLRGHSEEMEVKSIASISEDTSDKDMEICEIPSDLITEVKAPVEFISDENFESCSPSRVASSARNMITTNELAIFNNMIYHVKLLGHEDPRFQLITIKAYELISQFGDSENFFEDILKFCTGENDFASEIIRFIVVQKSHGISDVDLIKKIRQIYLETRESTASKQGNLFNAKPSSLTGPVYIEAETSSGSRKLTAKSKIAHKHKAIQYANVIGGKLFEAYTSSGESSFHQYIKKHCKNIADKGACSITTEDFEPYRNIIAIYKKSKKKNKSATIATSIITPRLETTESKADTVLRILDRLTSSRLPRYEVPSYPSTGSIIQREYKKTNPFDVYNDLVSSEYNPIALNDRRFAVLYQLILFISECVANGMSEDETISAMSSLRVVNKRDLHILRDREIRFKGLSIAERELVLDSEICCSREMTDLYIDLILHHKKSSTEVSLNDYITGVLLKNYKESYAAWRLLKYIYLKSNGKTNKEIIESRYAIMETGSINDVSTGTKGISEVYYSLEASFARLKYEYDNNIEMTHYNFNRDNITTDMLNETTLKKYLPKRFDSKGRLSTLVMVTPIEADLFKLCEKRNVGEHIYVLLPVESLSTKDLYGLLLTVNKQKRKL